MSKQCQKETGFTLVELLVVIAILGILATVATTAVIVFIGEGEKETASTEIKNIQLGVAAVMAITNSGTVTGTGIGNWTSDFTLPGIIFAQSGTIQNQLSAFLLRSDARYWYRISTDGRVEGSYDGTDARIFD